LETPEIPLLAAIAAFEHHVRYDMTGYPKRLYAKRISLASMMVAISDAYDAMRSKRPYHEGMAPERVYEEMMNLSGGQFHPGLVDNFFRMTGLYPPGTLVELDTGEVALVVKGNALDIKRPQAEVLYDAAGSKVKEPYIVNLAERDASTGGYKRTITKSISLSDKYDLPDKYK
jgi:HD-GYP domain-containing protein (c-di-GMP phosphodiesterase class II)